MAGFTFDDVIALPGSIDFGVEEVALDTRITRNIPMVREGTDKERNRGGCCCGGGGGGGGGGCGGHGGGGGGGGVNGLPFVLCQTRARMFWGMLSLPGMRSKRHSSRHPPPPPPLLASLSPRPPLHPTAALTPPSP